MVVQFYLEPFIKPSLANYQHQAIVLAEGLKTLCAAEVTSNIKYWFDHSENRYLFNRIDQRREAEISIYSSHYVNKRKFTLSQGFNVLIDDNDGIHTFSNDSTYSDFDLILKSHYVKPNEDKYLKNVIPWAFGLSYRMMEGIEKTQNQLDVLYNVLATFRVDHNLRDYCMRIISKTFSVQEFVTDRLPTKNYESEINLKSYSAQSGGRHNEDYFKAINSSDFLLAMGGLFSSKSSIHELIAKIYRKFNIDDRSMYFLYQWDSWRLWEGLYANCVPVHVDFGEFGILLPVMPVNGQHYLGIRRNFHKSMQIMQDLSVEQINTISSNGRDWAVKYYSPEATAKRLLDVYKKKK